MVIILYTKAKLLLISVTEEIGTFFGICCLFFLTPLYFPKFLRYVQLFHPHIALIYFPKSSLEYSTKWVYTWKEVSNLTLTSKR